MPKVQIIRKGASRPVLVPAQMARHLTKDRNWSYVDESQNKVSKPKRKAEGKHAASGDDAKPVTSSQPQPAEKESPQAEPETVAPESLQAALKNTTMSAGKPMTSARFAVKPTRTSRVGVPITTREELEAMTKADLKVLGNKVGLDLKPSEPKDVWVNRLNRYLRRDMRAVR